MSDAVNNLANLTALVNIMANGCEILGIACGAPNLIMSWVPSACGCPGYSLKIAAASVVLIVGGLASPGLINWSVATGGPGLAIVMGVICVLIIGGLFLLLTFLPTIIAYREDRPQKLWITVLNLCLFIPFNQQIALVWAAKAPPQRLDDTLNVNDHR